MRWKKILPFIYIELVVLAFFMWKLALSAMLYGGGKATVDFNHYGEGWPEVVMLTIIMVAGAIAFIVSVLDYWEANNK
jgi:hypothetical protein